MFFDNASTTQIDPEVLKSSIDFNEKYYFNPGALYEGGRQVKSILDDCRSKIKNCIHAEDGNVVFTGSASEANNLAIFGATNKGMKKILVSIGEHPSVYNAAMELKCRGYNVEFVKLNKCGTIDVDDFKKKMTQDVAFVSIMHVSNETGAINDIKSLVAYAKSINSKVIFHVDGVQACGKIEVNVYDLGVDMYTISAHKIYGPKGVGALYISQGIKLKPIVYGGGQENGYRSGTENVMGVVMFTEALEKVTMNIKETYSYILDLKEKFTCLLGQSGLKYKLHSDETCSPYIVSISFIGCRAESLLNMLSDDGVYVGNGSACSSRNSGNRILENMSVPHEEIESNIRISFSKNNNLDEIDFLVEKIENNVCKYLKNTSI